MKRVILVLLLMLAAASAGVGGVLTYILMDRLTTDIACAASSTPNPGK